MAHCTHGLDPAWRALQNAAARAVDLRIGSAPFGSLPWEQAQHNDADARVHLTACWWPPALVGASGLYAAHTARMLGPTWGSLHFKITWDWIPDGLWMDTIEIGDGLGGSKLALPPTRDAPLGWDGFGRTVPHTVRKALVDHGHIVRLNGEKAWGTAHERLAFQAAFGGTYL